MTDLTFVSHEELIAELGRRYPTYLLSVVYRPEGQPNMFAQRLDYGCGQVGVHAVLGLAHMAVNSLECLIAKSAGPFFQIPTPLDPPPTNPG